MRGGARGQRSQLGVNSCHFGRVKLRRRPDRALVPGLDPGITGPSTHHRWREGGWGHAPPSPRRSGARPNRQPPPPQRISTPGSTPACIAGRATGGWRPSNTRRRPLDQSSSPGPAPQRVNPDPWLRRRGLRCGRPRMGLLRTIATWHRGDARRWRRRPRPTHWRRGPEPRGEYLGRVRLPGPRQRRATERQGLPRTQPSQRRRDPRRPVRKPFAQPGQPLLGNAARRSARRRAAHRVVAAQRQFRAQPPRQHLPRQGLPQPGRSRRPPGGVARLLPGRHTQRRTRRHPSPTAPRIGSSRELRVWRRASRAARCTPRAAAIAARHGACAAASARAATRSASRPRSASAAAPSAIPPPAPSRARVARARRPARGPAADSCMGSLRAAPQTPPARDASAPATPPAPRPTAPPSRPANTPATASPCTPARSARSASGHNAAPAAPPPRSSRSGRASSSRRPSAPGPPPCEARCSPRHACGSVRSPSPTRGTDCRPASAPHTPAPAPGTRPTLAEQPPRRAPAAAASRGSTLALMPRPALPADPPSRPAPPSQHPPSQGAAPTCRVRRGQARRWCPPGPARPPATSHRPAPA